MPAFKMSNSFLKQLAQMEIGNRPKVHESEDQLIIGLDFGTTFSGIAYAFSKAKDPEPISVMDWPGGEGAKLFKIPTMICYEEKDKKVFTWGEMKHKTGTVAGVKLLLDPSQPRPLYLPESTAKTDLKQLGKPAVEVVADFIGAMYKHAMKQIEGAYPADYIAMCQKTFVLTVPAVWSDLAKNTTEKAAKMAGLHPINLIKEPEAAALYTLHVMQEGALAVDDAIVICDAGGGTVDLISYEITNLKPLQLKELVPGKGGMAGSLGLNRRFESAVKELVGEDQYFFLRKSRAFTDAVLFFDRSIKTAFRGGLDEDYLVNFPMAKLEDDESNNLVSNCWNMKGADVKAIFDPLIHDIERLVDEQVNLVRIKRVGEGHKKGDQIKAVFLVGGFGSSKYLKSRLEDLHPDIQIIQPNDAWAAIVRGAVLSKLPRGKVAEVVSTQSTRHYGVEGQEFYKEDRDSSQEKIWDASYGFNRVAKMTWYIYMGEDLLREQRIIFPFERNLPDNYQDVQLVFDDNLIQSENKTPPVYPAPGYTKTNCTLKSDLRGVDKSHFSKRVGSDGIVYHDIIYQLVVTIMPGAVLKFSLEINGKELGKVNAKYD